MSHSVDSKVEKSQKIAERDQAERRDLPQLQGLPFPDYTIPNVTDIDFVKVVLDRQTLTWLQKHVGTIESGATRHQIWRYLWDMLKDTRFSAQAYLEMAFRQLRCF